MISVDSTPGLTSLRDLSSKNSKFNRLVRNSKLCKIAYWKSQVYQKTARERCRAATANYSCYILYHAIISKTIDFGKG